MDRQQATEIVEVIAPVIETIVSRALAQRSEEIYGTIEELRQQVADVVNGVRETGQVMYDNQMAVMAELSRVKGDTAGEYATLAAERWRRFVESEAKEMGVSVMVAKS